MIVTRTPYRVSFFGGGTDYPLWFAEHGGAVLVTSIDKYCYISLRTLPPFFEYRHRVVWSKVEHVQTIGEIQHPVVRALLTEDGSKTGWEVHHNGDLPARTGLGSSSAFTVGMINALWAHHGRMAGKRDLAVNAIRVEQDVLKENVGCQDQIATAYGGFNRIDFLPNGMFEVSPVILPRARLARIEDACILFYTGLSRFASEVAGEKLGNMRNRVAELQAMRAMVDEAQSIFSGQNDPVEEFGRLLHESWQLKRRLAASITNSMIDEVYEAGRQAGALGGKLLGAGGGGFMLFVVPPERRQAVIDRLSNLIHVDFHFETGGSKIVVYEPNGLGER